MTNQSPRDGNAFDPQAIQSFYDILFSRRDVRGQFLPDQIPVDVLARLLNAAHHAPSVGLSQPWNFILVRDAERKKQVHENFRAAREAEAALFDDERQQRYRALKLEGILDAPLNLLITCDQNRGGPVVLGRTRQPMTALYSTVCAVQNLWLAARAEGLGVGWVSILDEDCLRAIFDLPEAVTPVAYLCLGYVSEFLGQPELVEKKWGQRLALEELVFVDGWQKKDDGLLAALT